MRRDWLIRKTFSGACLGTVALALVLGLVQVDVAQASVTSWYVTEDTYLGDGYVYGTGWESTGTHDGGDSLAVLTDTGASWVVDDLVGYTVDNETDGSTATITANTGTTVTGTLGGGSENDWDNGETYRIYDPSGNTGYSGAYQSDGDGCEYGRVSTVVGQSKTTANSVDTYNVWRSLLYFNTGSLTEHAVISSATVSLFAKEDHSTTDFDIYLVDGQELSSPPTSSAYNALLDETAPYVATPYFNTSSLPGAPGDVDGYECSLELNSDGISHMVTPGGVTRFGVRSSRDVAGTTPTGLEYVEFWASDKGGDPGYQGSVVPLLTIEYTDGDLGQPETMAIEGLWVFKDYLEEDDTLFVFRYQLIYPEEPDMEASEYYKFQLLDQYGLVVAEDRALGWGYLMSAFYIAPDGGVEWGGGLYGTGYTIKIVGDATSFATIPEKTLSTNIASWKGSDLTRLDHWVLYESAPRFEDYYGVDLTETPYDVEKLNATGARIFLTGLPNLAQERPHLFVYVEEDFTEGGMWESSDGTVDEDLGSWARLGTSLTDSFEEAGEIVFGLSSPTEQESAQAGKVIAAVCFAGLMLMVVGAVVLKTGNVPAATLCAVPVLFFGAWVGVYPMVLLAMAGSLGVFIVFHQVWLRST